MEMELWMGEQQVMDQRPSPTLITFTNILMLSSWQLQQAIHQEMASNPALEMSESDICLICGRMLQNGICYACLHREARELSDVERPTAAAAEDEFDPLTMVAAPKSMSEMLMEELGPALPAEDRFIAEYLVGNLDEKGFLTVRLGDAARTLGVSGDRVRRVLAALQQAGPVGVGARDVRECLILQLQRLESEGRAHPLARTILEDHFEELGRGQHTLIAQALHVSTDEVLAARDFIRQHLRPYPIPDLPLGDFRASPSQTAYIAPDIIFRPDPADPGQFHVEVVESRRFRLKINPLYRELGRQIQQGLGDGSYTEEERRHILEHIGRAQAFIGHMKERRSTLHRVAEVLAERQKEFLHHGVRYLKPLTRSEIARELGLHDSTISRAVADKFALLPWKQVIPLAGFFQASANIEDVIKELVASEAEPLSDDQLAQLLRERGFDVARRTVSKYRNRLGILPSTLR